MKNLFYSIFTFFVIVLFCSCDKKDSVEKNATIIGTWKLISVITPEGTETGDEGVDEIFYFGEDGSGYYQAIDGYDYKDNFRYERVENTLTITYSSHEKQFNITKLNKSDLNLYYIDKEDNWSETWILKKQ
jgi:lipoprotein